MSISHMLLTQTTPTNGLSLNRPAQLPSRISVIIGRNGSGKSRFLKAIADANIIVEISGATLAPSRIRHIETRLEAQLGTWHDSSVELQIKTHIGKLYEQKRGSFSLDPEAALRMIGDIASVPMGTRYPTGNIPSLLVHTVIAAADKTGKNVNALDVQDIYDFYSSQVGTTLGHLNITAVVRSYIDRIEENRKTIYENDRWGENKPTYSDEAFEEKFGPKPWDAINGLLSEGLGSDYRISVPNLEARDPYEMKFFRFDGQEISLGSLSSGEKSLLWLLLAMYSVSNGLSERNPRLLLLDEPDAPLHPQMIQIFYKALNFLSGKFDCQIILTTHSPTTVALAPENSLYEITEKSLKSVEKDVAISKLLIGVNQVSILYANRRQVYVESHNDEWIYSEIFRLINSWGRIDNPYISLAFIPAAPKMSESSVKEIFLTHFGQVADEKFRDFMASLNGEGNSAKVKATVDSLVSEGNQTVHGIIDWDLRNNPGVHLHVHGHGLFYSIENAILNPLTLGIYLLTQHQDKIDSIQFGLEHGFDALDLFSGSYDLQILVDAVCRRVLGEKENPEYVSCQFLTGGILQIPKHYSFHHGHQLQDKIINEFIFLKEVTSKRPLISDVLRKTIAPLSGRTVPMSFLKLYAEIQKGRF